MKTAIYGNVNAADLADAELFAGIKPTEFVTNTRNKMPADLPTEVILPDPKVPGEPGELQNHHRLVLHSDALICKGYNEHLVRIAKGYGLLIHEVM